MKIYNSIITNQYSYKPSLKGANHEWNVFGIDEGGQAKRDYIRQWRDKYYIPYQSIYEKEGRKSEFELKQLISDLVRKPVIVDNKQLMQLHLQNLNIVDKSSYRGAMLDDCELSKVKSLHEAGIRRIISIGIKHPDLQNECEKFGIDYMSIKFNNNEYAFKRIDDAKCEAKHFARDIVGMDEKNTNMYVEASIKSWKTNSRRFIDNFTKYIQNMQKGNVYMGCEFGTYNTDTAIMFDYLFNPKMQHSNGQHAYNEIFIDCAENLFHNLTDSDKLKMDWTKDFEQTFFKRLRMLKR